jgi:hypothetical protein
LKILYIECPHVQNQHEHKIGRVVTIVGIRRFLDPEPFGPLHLTLHVIPMILRSSPQPDSQKKLVRKSWTKQACVVSMTHTCIKLCWWKQASRGENGSGIPIGYWIRIVQIPVFRIQIRVFLYSGRIWVIPGYCSFEFGYGARTTCKYPNIRVGYGYSEFGYPFFSFSA